MLQQHVILPASVLYHRKNCQPRPDVGAYMYILLTRSTTYLARSQRLFSEEPQAPSFLDAFGSTYYFRYSTPYGPPLSCDLRLTQRHPV